MFSILNKINLSIIFFMGVLFSSYSWGFEHIPSLSTKPSSIQKNISSLDLKKELMRQYQQWEGVEYRLGGTDHSGIDCSAFVQRVMKTLDIRLPRTTHYQINKGEDVRRHALQPGDLLFFWTTPKTRHVGIYLGQGQFMHSSSSNGVTISHLESSYWSSRFDKAKRLIQAKIMS